MKTIFFAGKSSRVRPWLLATDGDALSAHPPLRSVSFPAVRAPDHAAASVADLRANLSRHRNFVGTDFFGLDSFGTDVAALGDPASAINALDSKIVARSAAHRQCVGNTNNDQTHSSRSLASEARQ